MHSLFTVFLSNPKFYFETSRNLKIGLLVRLRNLKSASEFGRVNESLLVNFALLVYIENFCNDGKFIVIERFRDFFVKISADFVFLEIYFGAKSLPKC